jgi:hypothetical protein
MLCSILFCLPRRRECELAIYFADFLAHYLAKFGALFGNARTPYWDRVLPVFQNEKHKKRPTLVHVAPE